MKMAFLTRENIKKRININLNHGVFHDNLNTLRDDLIDNEIYPEDIFVFDNESFITEAYRAILNREPDKKGFINNLKLLKNEVPKSYLLYSLIKSKEGRRKLKNKIIMDYNKLFIKYYIYSFMSHFFFFKKNFFLKYHRKLIINIRKIFFAKKYV